MKTRSEEYTNYINSTDWQRKRQQAFEVHGKKCMFCDATTELHIHHRNYKTLFNEDMLDLMVLCKTCHYGLHDRRKKKRSEKQTLRGLSKNQRMARNGVKTKRWLKDNQDQIQAVLLLDGDRRTNLINAFGKTKTRKIMQSLKSKRKTEKKNRRKNTSISLKTL